ncbi:adenylate/guanylate cyclase domain-containing protein [Endozoicomonas sp. YOMI1]|uniref:adenylate/guanylate cyclase domain-containing protein n=1 Tax=Endozoicomonas sp. YOMI1 TaxID=2828739 RepID=UPI002147E4B0|nr:adenylate/guanylate cyclase domain-containing protein [Endozoicomonas sp. YOMI1]
MGNSKTDLRSITKKFFSDEYYQAENLATNHPSMEGVYESASSGTVIRSSDSMPVRSDVEFAYQEALRPHFGKAGVNRQGVGPHPDFAYLKASGDFRHHYAVTLFVDIKGSTRLNLLMDIQRTAFVKNRILQAAVEVVRSLDGHPHRFMGDALMAFFGGLNTSKENAIADAINAAALIRFTMKEHIFPELDYQLGTTTDMAVRVGIDFGDDDGVLWTNFGFGEASEITAQGLNVDLASKLQGLASANHAMMGQNLFSFIDFPESYQSVKTKSGEPDYFVTPNISDKDGNKLNYKMRHLQSLEYQRLLPIPTEWKEQIDGLTQIKNCSEITYWCEFEEGGEWKKYHSVSKFLNKHLSLQFHVSAPTYFVNNHHGLKVIFTKQNHGKEARDQNQAGESSSTDYINMQRGGRNGLPNYQNVVNKEGTEYRGLHTMNVKVYSEKHPTLLLFQDWIGVYIV